MTIQRKIVRAQVTALGPREVEIIMSTAALARDGHILIPEGCILDNFRANPIMLWQHDADHPVGNIEDIIVTPTEIKARAVFAPEGISHKADEICGLVKSSVIRAVSVGFDPQDGDPIDPKKPRGGMRITRWELLECSWVSIPADTGAVVTAREIPDKETNMTVKPNRAIAGEYKRAFGKRMATRGLLEVANLAYLLWSLGFEVEAAKWEAAIEGDGSEVPGMLAEAFKSVADALQAMSAEEIAEELAKHDDDDEEDAGEDLSMLDPVLHGFVDGAKSKRARLFRKTFAMLRTGKALSENDTTQLNKADEAHERAMKHQKAVADNHTATTGHMNEMGDHQAAAEDGHTQAASALQEAINNPDDAAKHVKRAAKALDKSQEAFGNMTRCRADMQDAHEDAIDSHNSEGRSLKSAQRCVRAVLDGAVAKEGTDSDSKDTQNSAGAGESGGTENDRNAEFWKREAASLSAIRH